ncbi:MAG: peptide-binding protein [Planctomycetota bacterium]
MESRFGFRDALLVVLLLALIGSVWLSIWERDRSWDVLQRLDARLREQSEAMARLSDQIKAGAVAVRPAPASTNGDPAATTGLDEAFARELAPRADADFAFGGWYIDPFRSAVAKLTPLISVDVYARVIQDNVLDTLITRDPQTLEWKAWVAESWTVSDDGLTIAFDIRDGVNFADGEPLTADDVVFSYEMIMNPQINAPRLRVYYDIVESVVAESDRRVVFTLREPYFNSLSICGGMEILARHWYEQFSPDEFNTLSGLLFGSGPYRLDGDPEAWTPGSGTITLVRNDRYWGPRPILDRLVWREINDETALLAAFRNREVDRYGVQAEQYPQLSTDTQLLEQANLFEYETATSGYRYIGWNQVFNGKPTPFADRRVRLAMTMLTDRQAMIDELRNGLGAITTGPFNPLSDQADPGVQPWPYDPSRARELLAEAGYEDRDGDGVLESEAGEPLRFKLVYPSGNPGYQQMVLFLKDAYARAGVDLVPDPLEWTIMLQRINDRNFQAISLGWGGVVESDPKQIFHSASIEGGGDNYIGYRNPELDTIIDEARVTVDADKRRALWHEAHRILHEDQPYTFLFTSKSVVYIDKRFRNVEVTKLGLNGRTEYFVPADEQLYSDR